jgi:hypothetical protein
MSNEQIYLYRRKGLSDYATCDRSRYVELSQHKLFETMVAYTSPSEPLAVVLPEAERACDLAEQYAYPAHEVDAAIVAAGGTIKVLNQSAEPANKEGAQ